MSTFLFRACFLMLLALIRASTEDCSSDESCVVFVIDGSESALSASQCDIQAPGFLSLAETLSFAPTGYCGAYFDDTTGVVVTNLGGPFEVFAAPVVAECSAIIQHSLDAGVNIGQSSLYRCITACPYLTAPPPALAGAASTPSSDPWNAIPKKFKVVASKLNGYKAPLLNNFGAMRGSVDPVAAKVLQVLNIKIGAFDCACETIDFDLLKVASPSFTAAAILFPSLAFKDTTDVMAEFLPQTTWYTRSARSNALLHWFNDPPHGFPRLMKLLNDIDVFIKNDFAGLGEAYSSLGFLYGVLSQVVASTVNGIGHGSGAMVVNTAQFNFEVHPFQEAFAYLFFSPLQPTDSGAYSEFYGFALNMLVRRFGSPNALCKVKISSTVKASCRAKSAQFPPTILKYSRSFTALSQAKERFDSTASATSDGSFIIPGTAIKLNAPPLEKIEKGVFEVNEREGDVNDLGTYSQETDPSVAISPSPPPPPLTSPPSQGCVHGGIFGSIFGCGGQNEDTPWTQVFHEVPPEEFYHSFDAAVCAPSAFMEEECLAAFGHAIYDFINANSNFCIKDQGGSPYDPGICVDNWNKFLSLFHDIKPTEFFETPLTNCVEGGEKKRIECVEAVLEQFFKGIFLDWSGARALCDSTHQDDGPLGKMDYSPNGCLDLWFLDGVPWGYFGSYYSYDGGGHNSNNYGSITQNYAKLFDEIPPLKWYTQFDEIVCKKNHWGADQCSQEMNYAIAQYLSTESLICEPGVDPDGNGPAPYKENPNFDAKLCYKRWTPFLMNGMQGNTAVRRLDNVADVALPDLRSKTASAPAALAREDGVVRRGFGARRLGFGARRLMQDRQEFPGLCTAEGSDAKDEEKYAPCASALMVQEGCRAMLKSEAFTSALQEANAKVQAFYLGGATVLKTCDDGTVFTPSECADISGKEVSFLFGDSSANYGAVKTSSYVEKGFPAASRLDRMMNFFLQAFAAA